MVKLVIDLTPEQRAAAAERERLIKLIGEKHGLKAVQENLQRIGEKHGLKAAQENLRRIGEKLGRVSETLRKAKTAPPSPQKPTRQRRKGGGRKPLFDEKQRTWLQKQYSHDLKTDPRLALDKIALPHVKGLAKTKFGIVAEDSTLLRQIIRPMRRFVRQK